MGRVSDIVEQNHEEDRVKKDEQAMDVLNFATLAMGCAMIGFEVRSLPIGLGMFLILIAFMATISNHHDRILRELKKK